MVRRAARARMLSPTISVSERVNALGLKGALLYSWMISHADDQGRLTGKAEIIKATIVPLLDDISIEDIREALTEMEALNLIKRYKIGESPKTKGDTAIQLLDWYEFQALRDPQPSRYPAPDGWTDKASTQKRDEFGRFSNAQ